MTSRMNRPSRRRRGGFTLLEVLLVLAILVVIGGIAMVNFGGFREQANVDATHTQINVLKQGVEQYRIRLGSLPQSLDALRDGPSDPAKQSRWVAPIMNEIPEDAWGNPFNYQVSGSQYEISSAGPDGQMNTSDDIKVSG